MEECEVGRGKGYCATGLPEMNDVEEVARELEGLCYCGLPEHVLILLCSSVHMHIIYLIKLQAYSMFI